MFKGIQQRVFVIGYAGLLAILSSACALSGSAGNATMDQNTNQVASAKPSQINAVSCEGNADCPARVSIVKSGPSKPPLTFYQFKVRVTNRHPDSRWFVLRYRDPLESSGKFNCYKEEKHCFSAEQLWGDEKKQGASVVVIHFLGLEAFTALRLSKDADITLENYVMNTAEAVSDFDVWEVDSLLINGKTPLQDWLPYPVMSDGVVHIGERPKSVVLDWDKTLKTYRQDYPKEKVEFIAANVTRKWLVPVSPRAVLN
jgi:hypothetical protein